MNDTSPLSPTNVEARMKALELSHHYGRSAPYPPTHFLHPAGLSSSLDEAAALEAQLQR